MDDCGRYGAVDVADDGCVRSFREKSPDLGSGLINAGVYLFERRTLEAIPTGRAVSLERETSGPFSFRRGDKKERMT